MARKKKAKTPHSAFAIRITRLREALGYTQEQFAAALGVSRSRVAGWENDDSFIRYPETAKLKALANVDADFIEFGELDGVTPAQQRWLREKGVI